MYEALVFTYFVLLLLVATGYDKAMIYDQPFLPVILKKKNVICMQEWRGTTAMQQFLQIYDPDNPNCKISDD